MCGTFVILSALTPPISSFNSKVQCFVNEDCPYTESCIDNACHPSCNVRNPCAEHAVCVNINHGSDCKCQDGYHGNGYVGCQQGRVTFYLHNFLN